VFSKIANGEYSEKVQFLTNDESACAGEFGGSFPGFSFLRQFDEKKVHNSEINEQTVLSWMGASMIPTIQEFSEDSIEGIFGERKQAIILFRQAGDEQTASEKAFEEAANALKGQIIFVTSGVEDGIQSRLREFVGVTPDNLPTLRILDPANGMQKFTFEGKIDELSVADVTKFVDDFAAGNLAAFFKSEPIPETQEGAVTVVVGKSFEDVVIKSEDEILMKFYAPWCGHCKALAPVWEEVAEELKEVKGLKIANFDSTANEAAGVEVQGYPTLKFYKNGSKDAPMAFEGGRTKEEIIDWLKQNSEAYKAHLAGKHDEL